MASTPTPTPRDEIRALTGIRWFAAVWVLVYHAQQHGMSAALPGLSAWRWLQQAGGLGYLGVDLFFVLSGFVLTWTYADRLRSFSAADYARYLAARLARIYPVHLFVLLLVTLAVTGRSLGAWDGPWHGPGFRAHDFALHLGLVHSWGFGSWLSWNQPAWSISAEWFAYLWFPFLCSWLVKVRSPWTTGILACAAVTAVAVIAPQLAPRACLNVPQLGGLVRVTGEFIAGCCACHVVRSTTWPRTVWNALCWTSAAAVLGTAFIGRADPLALPWFVVLVASLAASDCGLTRFLATPAAVLGGRVSYSLYMVHFPMLLLADQLLGRMDPLRPPIGAPLWLASYAAAPVLVAWATWRWVEEPARRAIRSRTVT
ncbi:MAG: acyltransferase [Planctomycetes bacterium]|nr:acyltransferase [Planctomycetota bacterium]